MKDKRPRKTLDKISRAAGVSAATVSGVASGKGRVDPEMARKVRVPAAALGVDLERRNKAGSVAFVLSNRDLVHPVHARILQSGEAYCRERGWEPVIVPVVYPAHQHRAAHDSALLQDLGQVQFLLGEG